jgi:hypothetical protein
MVVAALDTPQDVVERNVRLSGEFTLYLANHPEIFEALPDLFELVLLPDDDPELRALSLDLLDHRSPLDRPVVFVRLSTQQVDGASFPSMQFRNVHIYAPVAVK